VRITRRSLTVAVRRLAPLLLSVLVLGMSPAPVPGSVGELVDGGGQRFPRFEASGIACFRGHLLVVDDTLNSLFVFDRKGRLSYRVESDRFPHSRAKFEGLAVDAPRGRVFVAGSHTGWDHQSLENSSVLLRLRLEERAGQLVVDESSVVRLPIWRGFERLGLWKPGGMNVEGLADDPRGIRSRRSAIPEGKPR
jgi:hypothetical protein